MNLIPDHGKPIAMFIVPYFYSPYESTLFFVVSYYINNLVSTFLSVRWVYVMDVEPVVIRTRLPAQCVRFPNSQRLYSLLHLTGTLLPGVAGQFNLFSMCIMSVCGRALLFPLAGKGRI